MTWKPGDNGWAIGTMAGGPFDGKTYGDLPVYEDGSVPSRIFIPRETDAPEQIYSTYDRQASSPEGGWLYVFAGDIAGEPLKSSQVDELPVGTSIRFAPEVAPPSLDVAAGAVADVDDERAGALQPSASLGLAPRFVIAQSWWIASELCRRHPGRRVYEWHPAGGQYDMLRVWGPGMRTQDQSRVLCDLNRNGTIHLSDEERLQWAEVFAAESPHEIVKRIEQAKGRMLQTKAPATTATSLIYRLAAQLLAVRINDRVRWDVRMEFGDSSGSTGSDANGFVDGFPSAQRALEQASERLTAYDVGEHFWGVLRGGECVAVLDDAGVAHTQSGALDLMPLYKKRHRLDDVVTAVLDAIG